MTKRKIFVTGDKRHKAQQKRSRAKPILHYLPLADKEEQKSKEQSNSQIQTKQSQEKVISRKMISSSALLVPLIALPLIYYVFFSSSTQPLDEVSPSVSYDYWSLETTPTLKKQIPCGLLLAPRSEQLHSLSTALIDSTVDTSTITMETMEDHRLTKMIEPGNWISAGSLWLRIDDATVAAPRIKVVSPNDEARGGISLDYSIKLGKDFLNQNEAFMKKDNDDEEDELYLRVDDKDVLIPFILPRLPFDASGSSSSDNKKSSSSGGDGGSQLIMREQVPCGIVLASNEGGMEIHPISTVIDSTIASSTISRKVVESIPALSDFVSDDGSEMRGILPADSFTLKLDEATVPSPALRILDDDHNHEKEYDLILGMFFLREHNAQMKDGDLYIEANNGQEQVLIPFIQPRESFDEANEEL